MNFGQWNEKLQRPELFDMLNGNIHNGENVRVFPISNWTEMDIWNYIKKENIDLPSLYFSHEREVVRRGNTILANSPYLTLKPNEKITKEIVRFRTIGDLTITGAVESTANSLDDIIAEVSAARETERGNRADDQRSEAAMEERKREGYF